MADFRGKVCDSCGKVVAKEEATKKTIRVVGPTEAYEYDQDLCPDCVTTPEGVRVRPLRRRQRKPSPETPAA